MQQAQAALDALLTPGSQNQIAEAEAQVRSAQAELELLIEGARDETIAAAAAAVTQVGSRSRYGRSKPRQCGTARAFHRHDHGC